MNSGMMRSGIGHAQPHDSTQRVSGIPGAVHTIRKESVEVLGTLDGVYQHEHHSVTLQMF